MPIESSLHRVVRVARSLALATSAGLLGCTSEAPAPPEPVRPVRTTIVTAGEDTHVRSFPGKVEAARKAELAFQVPGLLIEFPVREGQRVAKGELIGRLRDDEFRARLQTLQGQLDQARATLRALQSGERPEQQLRLEAQVRAAAAKLANARTELDRSTRLLESNAVSRADHERNETNYRIAQEEHQAAIQALEKGVVAREEDLDAQEAVVRSLEGRVVEANLQVQDTTLRAPYDGVIAQRFVEQNQNVQAKQPIVRFQDVDEIEIVVDVPETVMARVRAADIVELAAEFSAAPGMRFPVHLREIGQRADPTTQTFQVRVAMRSPQEANLLPGMTGNVSLTYRRASVLGGRIFVPITAIAKDGSGEQAAWVLTPDQTVVRRPVQVGEPAGGSLEIRSGLQPGDRIVVAGVTQLREGMKVRDLGNELGGSSR